MPSGVHIKILRVALLCAISVVGALGVVVMLSDHSAAEKAVSGVGITLIAVFLFVVGPRNWSVPSFHCVTVRTFLLVAQWVVYFLIFNFALPDDFTFLSAQIASVLVLFSHIFMGWIACAALSATAATLAMLAAWVNRYEEEFGAPGIDTYYAVFQTNGREALQYITSLYSHSTIFIGIAAALVPVIIFTLRAVVGSQRPSASPILFLLGIIFLGSPSTWGSAEDRIDVFQKSVMAFRAEVAEQRRLLDELNSERDSDLIPIKATFEGTVIFVIGESTSRRHMSLYGYHRDTTPNLIKRRSELATQTNTISSHSHTVPSLKAVLTTADAEGDAAYSEAFHHSLPIQLQASGFKTWWLSAQNEYGVWDNPVALIGKQTDEYKFVRTSTGTSFRGPFYDEQLVPLINQALRDPADRKFMFVHLMAGHADYCALIPLEKRVALDADDGLGKAFFGNARDRSKTVNCYDNAIRYVDEVLGMIMDRLESMSEPAVMVYLSDHGEDVIFGTSHNSAAHSAYHIEVPHIWFFNAAARVRLKEKIRTLSSHSGMKFLSSDHSHTILDMVGASPTMYQESRALSSQQFHYRSRMTTPRGDLGMSAIAYDDPTIVDRKDYLEWTRAVLGHSVGKTGDELRSKVWSHATNSIGKLLEAKDLFAGVELDIVFDGERGEFLVYHPPVASHGLTLSAYLSAAASAPSLRLWLDWKNPHLGNIEAAVAQLESLDEKFKIRKRAIIETASDVTFTALKIISGRGFRHAYYVPTDEAVKCSATPSTPSCERLAEKVLSAASEIGASFLSFDGRARQFMVHHRDPLSEFGWITWLMHLSSADPTFPEKLPPLAEYEAVLVHFPSKLHY